MQRLRFTGFWLVVLGMTLTATSRADEGDFWSFFRRQTEEAVVILRGQSPDKNMPPGQMRVAQGMAIVSDPYAPIEPCPPNLVPAQGFDPYLAAPPPQASQWQTNQIGLFGEFLYLHPRNADVPFGVPQNGIILPGSAPTGAVGVADLGYSTGFRAGAFFGLGPDARLAAQYTWFSSSADSSVAATAPDVINPLVLFPGTFNAGFSAQSATAHYSIDFQMIDIEYQVMAQVESTYWIGYILGARYVTLDQDFNATFPFAPPDGETSMSTSSDFTGIGPRAGVQGERCLFPRSGFRAYGKSSASLLVGQFKSSYLQTNQFNGTEVNTSIETDRIVPLVDVELGLAWLSPGQHVRLSGGYLISAWFNAVTTPAWIQSVQRGDYQPGDNTLTFDGLTARAELRF